MDAREWLRIVAAQMPGAATADRTASLLQFAPALSSTPVAWFSRSSAEAVAATLTAFPRLDEITAALRRVSDRGETADLGDARTAAFVTLFADRLAAGVPIDKLLTIAARHYPAAAWQAIAQQHASTIAARLPWFAPTAPEDRAARPASRLLQRLADAAPGPAGPSGATVEVFGPPYHGRELTPDQLAEARRVAARRNAGLDDGRRLAKTDRPEARA